MDHRSDHLESKNDLLRHQIHDEVEDNRSAKYIRKSFLGSEVNDLLCRVADRVVADHRLPIVHHLVAAFQNENLDCCNSPPLLPPQSNERSRSDRMLITAASIGW